MFWFGGVFVCVYVCVYSQEEKWKQCEYKDNIRMSKPEAHLRACAAKPLPYFRDEDIEAQAG